MLINEFSSDGRIDFLKFSIRRLQRLAPALLTMLLLSSVTLHPVVAPAAATICRLLGLLQCSPPGHNAERVYGALQAAASHYGNVTTVDLNELVCPDETCAPRLGNTYTYRDKQHLTDSFVKMISPQAIRLAGINYL